MNEPSTAERPVEHPVRQTHSPGPWYVDGSHVIGADCWCVAHCTESGPGIEGAKSNARLIAAAPELLEAARRIVAAQDDFERRTGIVALGGDPMTDAVAMARSAIHKAISDA
jgi:hypothetical protein